MRLLRKGNPLFCSRATYFSTSFHSRVQRVLIGISTYFFIACEAHHLLAQRRFSLASKLSFLLLISVKK